MLSKVHVFVCATLFIIVKSFHLKNVKTISNSNALQSLKLSSASNAISVARNFVATGFGLKDESILDDNFKFIFRNKVISKSQYITAFTKETSALQRAVPNFDFGAYAYQVDDLDPNKVWFKIRPSGTITGPFSFKGEVYLPNNKEIELPIQQFSAIIDKGKISKLNYGIVIDKLSGNTGGLSGPYGLLYALNEPPAELTYLPIAVVLRKFFGRRRNIPVRKASVSPFPEAVMIALASKIIDNNLGSSLPELLAEDFFYSSPLVGPLPKKEYIQYANTYNVNEALPDLTTTATNFIIDIYEPDRVWIVAQRSGTFSGAPLSKNGNVVSQPNNKKYSSSPEAIGISINSEGLCYKLTAGYVLDRMIGNTNGLGGNEGLLEAIGCPLPFWETKSYLDLIFALSDLFPSTNKDEKKDVTKSSPVTKPKPFVTKPASVTKPSTTATPSTTVSASITTPTQSPTVVVAKKDNLGKTATKTTTVKPTVKITPTFTSSTSASSNSPTTPTPTPTSSKITDVKDTSIKTDASTTSKSTVKSTNKSSSGSSSGVFSFPSFGASKSTPKSSTVTSAMKATSTTTTTTTPTTTIATSAIVNTTTPEIVKNTPTPAVKKTTSLFGVFSSSSSSSKQSTAASTTSKTLSSSSSGAKTTTAVTTKAVADTTPTSTTTPTATTTTTPISSTNAATKKPTTPTTSSGGGGFSSMFSMTYSKGGNAFKPNPVLTEDASADTTSTDTTSTITGGSNKVITTSSSSASKTGKK